MDTARPIVLIRGGGDLATGVAARLYRAGFYVVVSEIALPRAVRRLVAIAEAVFAGEIQVEDLRARLVSGVDEALDALRKGWIPVLIDPQANCRKALSPVALVDARMAKAPPDLGKFAAGLVIGLGPGFTAGFDCHAVVETKRGHHLGRVIWQGTAEPNTGIPEAVAGFEQQRVLRAPASGRIEGRKPLASAVKKDEIVATVAGVSLKAPLDGVLRGLAHDGLLVELGEKVGDIDPRGRPEHCYEISDKALAIGGGVLEALLSRSEIRTLLRS